MWVSVQRHVPAVLPPGKTRYPFYRRLGGPQGRYGRVRKISRPSGFDHQTVQALASRNTDWDISGLHSNLQASEKSDFFTSDVIQDSHKMSYNQPLPSEIKRSRYEEHNKRFSQNLLYNWRPAFSCVFTAVDGNPALHNFKISNFHLLI
jgi:hypothetical protein